MRRYDEFQKQISKYLDDVPKCTVHTNEILLRLIATELAVIVDVIGKLANCDYTLSTEDEQEEEEKENDGQNE